MNQTKPDIPQEVAFQLCAEIRQPYHGKWWTLAGMQCLGGDAATKGDLTKRSVSNSPGYCGCNLFNARYSRALVVRTGGLS